MLVIRCTAKLLARLKSAPRQGQAPSTTALGDWYATLLPLRPAHLILLVNERTRLAAVLPAKPIATLPGRVPEAIEQVLRELGASEETIASEGFAMREIVLARTASRSVLGTMNDFAFNLDLHNSGQRPPMDLVQLAMQLNRIPVSPLKYGRPEDVARALLHIAPMPRALGGPESPERSSTAGAAPIYQLKVTLRSVAPAIWRRIQVRGGITLASLHHALQLAMGWRGQHLHDFHLGAECFGEPHPDLPPRRDGSKVVLCEVLRSAGDRVQYTYDFGDGWKHDIELEQVLPPEPDHDYPRLVDGARACPPEDCGGDSGYEHLLEVLADPKHGEHRDLVAWVGGAFDPEGFDLDELNRDLNLGWRLPRPPRARTETTLPRTQVFVLPTERLRR